MTQKPMDRAAWERFKAAAKESARRSTFEFRVGQLEAICRDTPGAWPNRAPDDRPEEHSRAWYAEKIMFAIRAARGLLERGLASHAAAEALIIGALAAEADACLYWQELRRWRELVDNESKERALVGEVIRIVALAGQTSEECSAKRFGLDMEIEFKDSEGRPTAEKIYLQLKSGDSHLKSRKRDGAEIFRIRNKAYADYWMRQAYPVFLVIANSHGQVRWMEIRDYIKRESDNGKKKIRTIVFTGERFCVESVLRWRESLLGLRDIRQEDGPANPGPQADG